MGIIINEASAIENIPITTTIVEAIELIHWQVHSKSGKLISREMGKAGQIAHNIAATFSSTGTPAVFLYPSEAQYGDLGILQENDVLRAISNPLFSWYNFFAIP